VPSSFANPTPSRPLRRRPSGFRVALATTAGLAVGLTTLAASAATAVDPSQLPAPVTRPVSFAADVQPILDKACLRCHGAQKPKGGYRLDQREDALQGGESGTAIFPGDSAKSPLIHFVARLVEDMEMPPAGKGDPLTPDEIGILRAWVDQGAEWSAASNQPRVTYSFTPAAQFISVDGNEAKFREHYWMREGWGEGLAEYSLKYDANPRTRVTIEGKTYSGTDQHRFSARIERDDLGWVSIGYQEFSRYQDDTGGYYKPYGEPAPRLDDDLVLRHRHANIEFGLALPDWPLFKIGYDLHLRDGTEATLNWGALDRGGLQRAIYPGRQRVDETTHQVTLDISYDWNGLLISDQAQFEWHQQDDLKTNYDTQGGGFDFANRVNDRQDYWRGANVLRLERSLRDWLYVSGGYLYSQLEDVGGFSVESFSPSDPTLPPSLDLSTDDLTLRRRSHTANANVLIGPWEQLHFYAGLQADWSRQEGFAGGQAYGTPTAYDANLDRTGTEENFGLRYAGIPYTVLFAETRFQQETFSHFEEGLTDTTQAFLRDTDADGDLKDFEVGFTVSPWKQASLQAKYRRRDRANHYDHLRDMDLFSSGNGYPAFIRSRDTITDEFDTRWVFRPWNWLKATLRYSIAATDFETETDTVQDLAQVPPTTFSGGRMLAGQYDAHVVGAGFVLTPWTRLHFSTALTWTTSRSLSGINNEQDVVPYQGEIWNLLNSATFVVDEKTDFIASYLFSHADYGQDNEASTLPMGMTFTRHAATAGIMRRMKHGQTLRVEYGFFTYHEPTLGGAGDYTAHGIFSSYRIPLP
jgi:mono/diheme cytochrome c family protein